MLWARAVGWVRGISLFLVRKDPKMEAKRRETEGGRSGWHGMHYRQKHVHIFTRRWWRADACRVEGEWCYNQPEIGVDWEAAGFFFGAGQKAEGLAKII